MIRIPITVGCLILQAACATTGITEKDSGMHGMNHGSDTVNFQTGIELLPDATGDLNWTISTTNEAAQAYFNQGIQLRFAYGMDASARSFREAYKADSKCAICYWGEAYALGAYLNGAMSVEKAPHALSAINKAAQLAPQNANEMEQDLIEAMLVRYIENYDPSKRRKQDQAFAEAMSKVHAKYPDDLNIAAITASAWFLLEERMGTRDLNDPDVIRIHRILENALEKDIRHPGACHLYIHATESTSQPELALPCAKYIGNSIPGASHINHMPSHTWNEVGRWGDSVRANLQAWQSDLKSAVGKGVAIYPTHNLHMLFYSASYDGQGAIAVRAAKDYATSTGDPTHHALTLIRFGRFEEISELLSRPESEAAAAIWDFAQGYAALRAGSVEEARDFLQALDNVAHTTTETLRFHPATQILGTLAYILQGEILRTNGDLTGSIESFEHAVAVEDQMGFDEPEPLPFAARHWLGAALLELGHYEEAANVYREELEDHPHNGWSLYGLQTALTAQGITDRNIDKDLEKSWARADIWLRSSRF